MPFEAVLLILTLCASPLTGFADVDIDHPKGVTRSFAKAQAERRVGEAWDMACKTLSLTCWPKENYSVLVVIGEDSCSVNFYPAKKLEVDKVHFQHASLSCADGEIGVDEYTSF